MCGIAGFLDLSRGRPPGALARSAATMAATLAHRGPDGSGSWADAGGGLAFGHTRLAVIDPGPGGDQPMLSADGRFAIVYNGEIYNHAELARELAARNGPRLRGRSDTEVLLECCAHLGIERTLARADGMFAFALWDRRERRLWLARDRLGIKPLYWARAGRMVLFGSEIKAILAHPGIRAELDRDGAATYFALGYLPAPHTIYRDVFKLRPGHIIECGPDGALTDRAWWDLAEVARNGAERPLTRDAREAEDALDQQLAAAVRAHMVSDVPLGAFLSGGIDSTTVVALMTRAAEAPVRTFTIGFDDPAFDESAHAKVIAHYLGTDHQSLTVTAEDARAVIPLLPQHHDEPFADPSAIPTFLLSQLARASVTVALSGDGGDELFGGYDRYRIAHCARMKPLPAFLRRSIGGVMGAVPPGLWNAAAMLVPGRFRPRFPGDRVPKLARVLKAPDDDALYRAVGAIWDAPERLVPGAVAFAGAGDPPAHSAPRDFASRMQLNDILGYLPDDILAKVDRASMAVGLEARVPILDHRVVELAWRLPPAFRYRRGNGKWLLKRVLARHVPDALFERPKQGFAVPVGEWIRGPLRDWAEALIAPDRLRREGTLEPALVTRRWREHLSGRRNWSYQMWAVLMFQAWRERWLA